MHVLCLLLATLARSSKFRKNKLPVDDIGILNRRTPRTKAAVNAVSGYDYYTSDFYKSSLPVIPITLDLTIHNRRSTSINLASADNYFIPRNVWLAFRSIPKVGSYATYLEKFINRCHNDSWSVNMVDGDGMDKFMKTYFSNSSIYWAYNSFSEYASVSKVDIWRYCVLYTFGGFFLDDDAYIESHLREVMRVFLFSLMIMK